MAGVYSRPGTTDFKYQYIYDSDVQTFTAPRTRWVNKDIGKVWDEDNNVMAADADTPTPADTLVAMTDHTATIGGWLIVVPTHANFVDGNYDMLVVENADWDTVLIGKHAVIKDNKIVSLEDL